MKSVNKKTKKNRVPFEERIQNSKSDLLKRKWLNFLIPGILIIAGLFVMIFAGFNKGIDFTGGTVMSLYSPSMDMSETNDYDEAKSQISDVLKDNGVIVSLFQKSESEGQTTISFRFQNIKGLSDDEMDAKINNEIIPALAESFEIEENSEGNYSPYISSSQRIGATASSDLLMKAFYSILVAVVLILIYIAIRFEIASGLAAIVALLSDVFVTAALVAIFRIQINSPFIAALITIIGYSINNTIIIFDRVRENRKTMGESVSNNEIANASIKQSLVRTINTTITTLVAILLLAIIGVDSVREFTLPIIFGLIAGTYSSIFVAPSLWALMYRPRKSKQGVDKSSGTNSKKTLGTNDEIVIEKDDDENA